MKNNMNNLAVLFVFWLILTLGCGGGSSSKDNIVERGRLKFTGFKFYVNGKRWSPEGDKDFAEKVNWCDTSPNPNVEILRCPGGPANYDVTYILRMKNDKPEVQKIDGGLPSIWTGEDGHWLLFSKFFVNVETGEKIDIKLVLFNDGREKAIYPLIVVGVSPDLKTIVELPSDYTAKDRADDALPIWIIDVETGKVDERKVSLTKNRWLTKHQDPQNNIQPPPEPSKNFVWERGADGRDKLIVPQLLEKTEVKKDNK
jgi:hypothetical protein